MKIETLQVNPNINLPNSVQMWWHDSF